jgi:F-type H+-transporting ATPase subunit b
MLQIDLTLFVTFAVVWILVFVLTRIFWRPMMKVIDDRKAQLKGDDDSARANTASVEDGFRRIDASLKAARVAADRAREELEVEALKEKSLLLAEVGASAKLQTDQAKAELQDELTRLRAELDGKAGDLASKIEAKLLRK